MLLEPKSFALLFTVVLLAVTAYFLLGSVPLLVLKHDNPMDSRFIRSFYITYFRIALIAAVTLAAQPAAAQSILRDAETEALLHDMAAPLVKAAGLDAHNVDVVVINDPSLNAFVAGGQVVYIHSGLLNAASSANEVQGEIGRAHV